VRGSFGLNKGDTVAGTRTRPQVQPKSHQTQWGGRGEGERKEKKDGSRTFRGGVLSASLIFGHEFTKVLGSNYSILNMGGGGGGGGGVG